jgi:putative ATPase
MPEGRIPLAEATIFLALAPKSNSAYLAINDALADVRSGLTPNVPAHLRSNELSRSVDKTTDYIYPHEEPRMIAQQDYADKKVLAKNYYLPKASGKENAFVELWAKLRAIIRKS